MPTNCSSEASTGWSKPAVRKSKHQWKGTFHPLLGWTAETLCGEFKKTGENPEDLNRKETVTSFDCEACFQAAWEVRYRLVNGVSQAAHERLRQRLWEAYDRIIRHGCSNENDRDLWFAWCGELDEDPRAWVDLQPLELAMSFVYSNNRFLSPALNLDWSNPETDDPPVAEPGQMLTA
jgi:hypothetical protein